MGKFIIVKEKSKDKFTKSSCNCEVCKKMNNTYLDKSFVPKNHIQKRVLEYAEKLEKRILNGEFK